MARSNRNDEVFASIDRLGATDPDQARGILVALLENSADAQLAVDREGRIIFANRRTEQIFGHPVESLLGESIERLIPDELRNSHAEHVRRFCETSNARLMGGGLELTALRADGQRIPVEIGLSPFEVNGNPHVLCSVRSIEKRKKIQEALSLSEIRSNEVQRIAKIGNWDWNVVANELWWSDEIYRMFGTERESFACTYEAFLDHVHPDDRERVRAAVDRALNKRAPYSIRHRIVMANGTERVVHEKAEVVCNAEGVIERMVGTVQDVTDYNKIEAEVLRSEARLREAEQLAKVGSWEWDMAREGQWWSDGLYAILEADPSTVEPSWEFFISRVHPDDRQRMLARKSRVFDAGRAPSASELRLLMPDGREKVVLIRSEVRRDENGGLMTVFGSLHDITERKQAEDRVRYLATHDEMTDLPNRPMFNELLNVAVKNAQRYGHQGAVLYIDLDGFKYINDSLGHSAGDELLEAIGYRLRRVLREADCAARLGGDEFCVLAGNILDERAASVLAEKCLEVIAEPLVVAGRELQPRASIGITLFPDDGQDCQTLMKAADSAMYAAKNDTQHRFRFYSSELTTIAERRMALEHDLRRSIQLGEFVLHYQPQIDLVSGRMLSVEALVRWEHPRRGLVGPDEFIDIAEKTGLIVELGEWVLRRACEDAVVWNAGRADPIRVAVNISSQHFKDGRIEKSVAATLRDVALDPDLLEIEVTETVMQASEHTIESFYSLQKLGVHMAIDDFGTGYSCLESLRRLPIDTLKIDQRFIHDLLESPETPAIIGTIVAMGRAMNLRVIAEGVETLEQTQYLCALGCEMAQGFFFSSPVTSEEIGAFGDRVFLPGESTSGGVARPVSTV